MSMDYRVSWNPKADQAVDRSKLREEARAFLTRKKVSGKRLLKG